jgi:hypothetical protein
MASYDDPYSGNIVKNGIHWWKSPEGTIHENVFAYVGHLDRDQSYKSSDNLRYMRLYGNYEMLGLDSYSYTRVESSTNVSHRVTLNVVQSIIDTVISKLAKNKPKPTFLTDGGDWSLQRRAKKLTKFCEGIFNSTELYKISLEAMKDACIFGTGAVKIFKENGNIKAERVFIEEIKVDDREAYYSKPRQIHQVKYVHQDILKEMFPKAKFEIEQVNSSANDMTASSQAHLENMVKVVESWHLPSGKTKDKNGKPIKHDGTHTICINNKTLFTEPYEKQYFPFVFFKWNEKPIGFWGLGLSEQLQGLQLEINKILRTIQVSMHLCSIPKLLVEASSKVVTAHLNNKIGGIIKYAGTPPKYEPLGGVPSELFTHLDRLYERAYEISGVSQLAAQSQKPGGLDSGKALREFNDIESERFMEVGQRYERAFMDAATIMVDIARDIYKSDEEFKVQVKGRKFIETIDWSEVDMEDDKFLMDIFPTSALSNTPAGRLQDVQDLLSAGFISKEDGMKLLDFPDLESTMSLLNAGLEDIEKQIELMVEKGEYQTPEPYQNLEMGIKKCQQAYLKYKAENAPDSRLELLRRWMEDAQSLLTKAAEGTMAPPPMPQQSVPQSNATPNDRATMVQQEQLDALEQTNPAVAQDIQDPQG